MPQIDWNRSVWDGSYSWKDGGEEWSAAWGSSVAQWFGTIYPRIHKYLPAKRILEIAPGFGRWTRFLIPSCDEFSGIDLSLKCVEACRMRFPRHSNDFYHNDGFDLSAVTGQYDFSSLVDRFVLNTADFEEYYAKIEAGHLPVNRGLVRSKEDLARWAVVLPLKNRTIRERDFQRVTGGMSLKDVFPEKMRLLKEAGLVVDTKWGVALTTLGCFFADETVQQFFEPDHLPFPADDYMPGPLHPLNNNQLFGSTLIAAE